MFALCKVKKLSSSRSLDQLARCLSYNNNNKNLTNTVNNNSNSLTKESIEAPKPINPITRTFNLFKNDYKEVKKYFKFFNSNASRSKDNEATNSDQRDDDCDKEVVMNNDNNIFPNHCDVLIIGGGGIGSSTAYWVKQKARYGLNVVVVEKDNTYCRASTTLSVGGLRQQFSLPENIQMSLYGAEFLRNCKEYLGDNVNINFTPYGYLLLATEEGAETLNRNSLLQNEIGAKNEILTKSKLQTKFPWINTDGIALGCHGLQNEGWFDPWSLLIGFKNKALSYGAQYVNAEVIGFEFESQPDIVMDGIEPGSYQRLSKALVKLPNGELTTIKFGLCVIAAGAFSGEVAKLAGVGVGNGMLSVPLPVEPRKRYVYVVETQGVNYPGLNTPLTVDPSNAYFRREGLGGLFLAGKSPNPNQEPTTDTLDVDYNYFETDVWPHLANRVPAFESLKVKSAWAGFYDYNTYDENGIISAHPYYHNLYVATGFSGHGIQQAPAVGRAMSELIIDGQFRTIDLSRLAFDRIIVDQPMYENNIV